jgi:RNA polymerase sigma-70 factor (ECF subfamily)
MVRVCGNKDDAEDALAEALLQALKAAGQLRDDAAFKAWLAQIGRRICGRMRGRPKFAPIVEALETVADVGPLPDQAAAETHMKDCVRTVIESLPEVYRQTYVLREIEGLSGEETARRLGITVSAMKSRLNRARVLVRHQLNAYSCASYVDF